MHGAAYQESEARLEPKIAITEKYEYNGWPSSVRPDLHAPDGWSLELITAQERYRNHQLSPDGKSIVCIRDGDDLSDIALFEIGSGWPRRVTTGRGPVAYWDDEIPQWSPDGNYFAYTIRGQVQVADRSGKVVRTIPTPAPAWAPRWMPDSNSLIISMEQNDTDQFFLTDRQGSWPRQLTSSTDGDHWDARPAPDGQTIVYVLRPFTDLNRNDIQILNLNSLQNSSIYGKSAVRTRDPRWSPDGSSVAFISQEAGHDDVWIMSASGEGHRQLTRAGCDVSQFVWAPDGKRILLTLNHAGAYDLAMLEIESGSLLTLRSGEGVHNNLNWAKDGSFVTFEYESPVQNPEIFTFELESRQLTQLTCTVLPGLQTDRMVLPERVGFNSTGEMEIPGFYYAPQNPNGAGIVLPHGGPSAQYALEWDLLTQYWVAKGYAVLAPNYRGSTGYGVTFEHANYRDWGKGDVQDCLKAGQFLRQKASAARLAIVGASYGGYLANCCLARDPEYIFDCGISKYGDANILTSWALAKRELRLYTEIFLGHPAQYPDEYSSGSPIHDVQKVNRPVLLLHGLDDDVVPPQASEEWAQALRTHGKSYEYKTYAGEGHGFLKRTTMLDAYCRMERFLDWYLLPRP